MSIFAMRGKSWKMTMSDGKLIIIVDTREQRPFHFSDLIEVRRAALPVGDYSLPGLEDQVVIERKSLSDLLGSITSGRERFVKELRQLRAFRFAALVIEARWPDILSGMYGCLSQVHPNSVIGSLMSFAAKYNVIPILADDHDTAARLTERLLILYASMIRRDCKALDSVIMENKK